VPPGK
jgi:hypothetical protein